MNEVPLLLRNQVAAGLVGSELPATRSGLRIAPASFSPGIVSLNGERRLFGPGVQLDATIGGLLAVNIGSMKEHVGLKKGKKLFMISDFGDAMAQGEYMSSSMSVLERKNVVSNIVSIPDIGARNISHGAWATKQQLKQEEGTVAVTVVDPGVGTKRKPILIVTKDNNVLIGPNNGVLFPAASEHGIQQVYELDHDKVENLTGRPISNTFHGRDLFGPAGALASSGVDISEFTKSKPVDREDLIEFELQEMSLLHIDKFGNLKIADVIPDGATSVSLYREKTEESPAINVLLPVYPKFADARLGTLCAYTGSSGGLEIAINDGDANEFLSSAGFDFTVGHKLGYSFGFERRKFPAQLRI